MADTLSKKTYLKRWSALKSERSSWVDHWQEISENLLPRSGKFSSGDRNDGKKKHGKIFDSTGTKALRILAAGMMSGMTSPARPWFRLTVGDNSLAQSDAVKVWLSETTQRMLEIFAKSNTYRVLHKTYAELGAFGTGGCIFADDWEEVIRIYPLTIGSYAIATDFRGVVTTVYREIEKTVGELVGEFGLENCSDAVKQAHGQGNLDQWVTVIHVIEPRRDRDPGKKDARNMPYRSIYFEMGGDSDKILRESGFKRFRAMVPRWDVDGDDIYGTSPAMEALGDIKQLQHEQSRKSQGIDYKTNPPLQMPSDLKNREVDTLPGGITFYDAEGPSQGIRSAFEVNLDLSHLLEDIRDVRERIRSSFYADLFLMLANGDLGTMTATEVAERHEEKLLMLGPVLERLHNELLDPLIDLTFEAMLEAGVLPPIPDELRGQNIGVEYVSMLAQAQRAIGTNSIDRFVNTLAGVAQIKQEVLDKFDADYWAEVYGDMLGVDPKLIVSDEQVKAVREARANAAAQQQQAEQLSMTAQAARNLAGADTSGQNALTDVTKAFSGYT